VQLPARQAQNFPKVGVIKACFPFCACRLLPSDAPPLYLSVFYEQPCGISPGQSIKIDSTSDGIRKLYDARNP